MIPNRVLPNWIPAVLISLVSLGSALAQTENQSAFQRITAPQIVVADNFTSSIVLLNVAGTTSCNFGVVFHQGAGMFPDPPLLTNGQNIGNIFQDVLGPGATRTYNLTTQGNQFVGAATIDILDPACFHRVNVQVQYSILNPQNNQIAELFSHPSLRSVPLGSCAVAPVHFDPDASDGLTNNPGLANVSLQPLTGVQRCMDLHDANGNQITNTQCENFNGEHDSRSLSQLFPGQQAFNGSWRVCFPGNPDPTATVPTTIDTLFIDVVSSQGNVQFDSNEHGLENPACQPSERTLCLNDDRFKVEVEFDDPAQSGQVADLKPDDTGFFFFTDPNNFEVLVKVLDGCGFNNNFWVFYASTTNVEYTMTVTDTQTSQIRTYSNPLGQASPAVTDTQAFATCP